MVEVNAVVDEVLKAMQERLSNVELDLVEVRGQLEAMRGELGVAQDEIAAIKRKAWTQRRADVTDLAGE